MYRTIVINLIAAGILVLFPDLWPLSIGVFVYSFTHDWRYDRRVYREAVAAESSAGVVDPDA